MCGRISVKNYWYLKIWYPFGLIGAVTCQRTDRHDVANGRFSQPKNERDNGGHPSDPKALCVGFVHGPRPDFDHCSLACLHMLRMLLPSHLQSRECTFFFSVLVLPLIKFFVYCVLRCWQGVKTMSRAKYSYWSFHSRKSIDIEHWTFESLAVSQRVTDKYLRMFGMTVVPSSAGSTNPIAVQFVDTA
jgi:hypothetical protein